MIEKNCQNCSSPFKTYPSLDRLKYCSKSCYWKGKVGSVRFDAIKSQISKTMKLKGLRPPIIRGADSNLWRGGVDKINKPLSRLIRDSHKYKIWRKEIMERDDYTCQFCNQRGGRLNVDHYPYSFISILKMFLGINTVEDAYGIEFLWDTDNGRTLCERCHQTNGNKDFKGAGGILFD